MSKAERKPPPRPISTKREKLINIRVSTDEHDMLKQRAGTRKLGTYLRDRGLASS